MAEPILQSYTWRTDGSAVRKLPAALLWDHRHADPDWGEIQAAQCKRELDEALKDMPVSVVRKKGILEVLPKGSDRYEMVADSNSFSFF